MSWTLVLVLALLLVANLLNNRLLPRAYVVSCVVAAALLLVVARASGLTWAELALSPAAARAALPWAVLILVAVGAGFAVMAAVPRLRPALRDDRAAGMSGRGLAFAALVEVPLGTVLLEEVGFRSVLYAVVSRDAGVVWATAVSSVLFGLWHVLPSVTLAVDNALGRRVFGTNRAARVRAVAFGVVFTAAAGVGFCWLREVTDSLLAPAALHVGTNSLGFVAAWLVTRPRAGGYVVGRPGASGSSGDDSAPG